MKKLIVMMMLAVIMTGCVSRVDHTEKRVSLHGTWESDTSIYVKETDDWVFMYNRWVFNDSIVLWYQELKSKVLDSKYDPDKVNYHIVGDSILLFNYEEATQVWRIKSLNDTVLIVKSADNKVLKFRKL